ncbi:MAG: glycosyltransferase family 39 protein [Verrucomicrobiales bacterium]
MAFPRKNAKMEEGVGPRLLWGLVALAALVRLVYFLYAHEVYGDAVAFAEIARSIVAGTGTAIDSSWYQAFCLYQVPFQWLISDPVWAAALSSMLPGALLVWPVVAITDRIFSRGAAIVAGLITIFHPHLVNYSCIGYMESFYLFWFSVTTLMLVRLFQTPGQLRYATIAGIAAGIAFATRNEFSAFIVVTSAVLLATIPGFMRKLLNRWSAPAEDEDAASPCPFLELSAVRVLVLVLCFNVTAALTTGIYAGVSKQLTGSYGLFEKTSNFGRTKDIFNQRAESAREIYGSNGQHAASEEPKITPVVFVKSMAARFLNNITHGMVKAVPNLLASPVYVFAGFLLVAWWRRPRIRMEVLPVIMMLGFTPALYSLIFVQPRYLQPVLPALNVLTGAGFMIALSMAVNIRLKIPAQAFVRATLVLCLLLLTAITGWRATKARSEAEIHEKVAHWVNANIDDSELLIGCGFGSISNTAFLSHNKSCPRLVTDSPGELADFVENHAGRWLLLYEKFIDEANPGLAPALDTGLPGFTKVFEEKDAQGKRVQVHRLLPSPQAAPEEAPIQAASH